MARTSLLATSVFLRAAKVIEDRLETIQKKNPANVEIISHLKIQFSPNGDGAENFSQKNK
jgi:hypothetical protein